MKVDALIVLSVLCSYGFFVALHLITFRFLKTDEVLKSLMRVVVLSFLFHFVWLSLDPLDLLDALGLADRVLVFVVSFAILALLLFVHVLCVFGPYETSIRLRLIRELFRGPGQGMREEAILKNYNAEMILKKRLGRLSSSGELLLQDGRYRINKHVNVFFFIDFMAGILKRMASS